MDGIKDGILDVSATMNAPVDTAMAEDGGATAFVQPPTEAAPELAWTLEDHAELETHSRRPWPVAISIAAALILGAGVLVGAIAVYGRAPSHPIETITTTPTPTESPAAAPEITPTVAPPPTPTATATHEMTDDDRYIAQVLTWAIDPNSAELIANAHAMCKELQQGKTAIQVRNDLLAASPGLDQDSATRLVADAMTVYPDCH